MFLGTALIISWIWFLANYQNLPIAEVKQLLLIFGIGVILMIIELVWEVKAGFKVVGKLILKIIIFPIKKAREKKIAQRLFLKLKTHSILNKKDLKWLQKLKKKESK